jgi:hypothetical protein
MGRKLRGSRDPEAQEIARRARALWPWLNARLIGRCRGDPSRIAKLVAQRTSLPIETIVGMLRAPGVRVTGISVEESETWFG